MSGPYTVMVLAITLAGCAAGPAPVPSCPPVSSACVAPKALCVRPVTLEGPSPAAPKAPFGDSNVPDLTVGSAVSSLEDLPRVERNGTPWAEIGREQVVIGGKEIWLRALERPGEEAALVVLRAEGSRFQVAGMLGLYQGGLGVSLAVVEHWSDAARSTAFAVVQINRRFRGFQTEAGKWVTAGGAMSWAVIGLSADSVWLARPEDQDSGRLRIVDTAIGPALAAECAACGGRNLLFPYEAKMGRFVGACDARSLAQAPRP